MSSYGSPRLERVEQFRAPLCDVILMADVATIADPRVRVGQGR